MAVALHDWLPDVLHHVDTWVSDRDIHAGEKWGTSIAAALEEINFGILCLTEGNYESPWVLFEAGALAKSVSESAIYPFLIDIAPDTLSGSPLGQYQAQAANEVGTWEIVRSINRAIGAKHRTEERLRRSFDRWWPDLNRRLRTLPDDEQREESKVVEGSIATELSKIETQSPENGNGSPRGLAELTRKYMSLNLDPVNNAEFWSELARLGDQELVQLRSYIDLARFSKKDLNVNWWSVVLGKRWE